MRVGSCASARGCPGVDARERRTVAPQHVLLARMAHLAHEEATAAQQVAHGLDGSSENRGVEQMEEWLFGQRGFSLLERAPSP
jgi:hypothetical protein